MLLISCLTVELALAWAFQEQNRQLGKEGRPLGCYSVDMGHLTTPKDKELLLDTAQKERDYDEDLAPYLLASMEYAGTGELDHHQLLMEHGVEWR